MFQSYFPNHFLSHSLRQHETDRIEEFSFLQLIAVFTNFFRQNNSSRMDMPCYPL